MFRVVTSSLAKALFVTALILSVSAGSTFAHGDQDNTTGVIYTLTNVNGANRVAVWNRAADGTLTPAGSFGTGGRGTGSGLGSQGSLALSKNNRWLFAVNAASDSITTFAVFPGGLRNI